MSAQRHSRASRLFAFLRRPAVIGGGTLLVVALMVVWWKAFDLQPVKGWMKAWRNEKFMGHAQQFYTDKKYLEADKILVNILRDNSRNLNAWQLRLKIAEAENEPVKVAQMLNSIVALQPDNLDYRLRLAKFLVERRAHPEALEILKGVPESQVNRPEVLKLAGEIAMASYKLDEATVKFEQLLKVSPDDKSARFNLAVIRLNSSSLITVNESRDELRSFLPDPEFRLTALRLLLTAAIRFNATAEIKEYTRRLSEQSPLSFADRVMLLSGQRLVEKPAYERTLAELKREAETEADKAGQLAQFFTRNRMFAEAEKFLASLPEDLAAKPEFALLLTEALVATKDWPTLEQKLRSSNWERIEYARLAFLAYALRAQGREKEFTETWDLALIAANASPENTRRLLAQVEKWNWRAETMALMWKVYDRDPMDNGIYQQLIDLNMKAGNTSILQRVFGRRVEAKPDDLEAKNNHAYLSMLINSGTSQAYRAARDVYESNKANPYFITSYAIAQLRQRQPADALKTFETMPADQRVLSVRALHYAVILAANNRRDEAKASLQKASLITALPEEKQLFESTKEQLGL